MTAHTLLRLTLPCLLAFAAAQPAAAQSLQSKRFGISSFERIEVQGDMIVEITPSNAISAVAEGDSNALDTLSLEVRERTLLIRQSFEGSYGARRPSSGGPLRLRITAQNLSAATLAGSGSIRVRGLRGPAVMLVVDGAGSIDAEIPDGADVSSRAVGSGTITIAGRARTLTAVTNGAASINAMALPVRDLTVQAVGSGASHFAASATANIFAMGSANVTVDGAPRCTVRNTGAGTIACGDDARNRLPQRADAN